MLRTDTGNEFIQRDVTFRVKVHYVFENKYHVLLTDALTYYDIIRL